MHYHIEHRHVRAIERVFVQPFLTRLNTMLPLKKLRDRDIGRVPDEQHCSDFTILDLRLEVTGIVMKIAVMRETYTWNVVVPVMSVVAFDQRAAREIVPDLKKSGHQHAQPGTTALAARYDRDVRAPQAPELFSPSKPPLELPPAVLRKEEQKSDGDLTSQLLGNRRVSFPQHR
jgi:hypothetical protein